MQVGRVALKICSVSRHHLNNNLRRCSVTGEDCWKFGILEIGMVSWHLLGLTAPGELKFGRLKLDAWPMLDELHKANK